MPGHCIYFSNLLFQNLYILPLFDGKFITLQTQFQINPTKCHILSTKDCLFPFLKIWIRFFRFQNQRNPECRQAKRRKKPDAYTHKKNRHRKNTTTELFVLRNPIKVLLIDRVRNRQTCTTFSTTASKHLASVGSRHS